MEDPRIYRAIKLGGNKLCESVGPGYQSLLAYFQTAANPQVKNPDEWFNLDLFTKTLSWGFPKSSVEHIKNFYAELMDVLLVTSIKIINRSDKKVPFAQFDCEGKPYGGVYVGVSMDFLEDPTILTNEIDVEMAKQSRKDVSKELKELSDYLRFFGVSNGIRQMEGGKYLVSISVPHEPKRQHSSSFMENVVYTPLEKLIDPDIYYLDQLVDVVWASAEALARIRWKLDPNRPISPV